MRVRILGTTADCRRNDKERYPTERAALDTLKKFKRCKGGHGNRKLSAYSCIDVDGGVHWHLGRLSEPKREPKPAKPVKQLTDGEIRRRQRKADEDAERREVRFRLHEAREAYFEALRMAERYIFTQ